MQVLSFMVITTIVLDLNSRKFFLIITLLSPNEKIFAWIYSHCTVLHNTTFTIFLKAFDEMKLQKYTLGLSKQLLMFPCTGYRNCNMLHLGH